MKHQVDNVRSFVYQYGTVPARIAPVKGEDLALAQMRLARRLWNLLVAIERARTRSYRRVTHDEVQEQIDQLFEHKKALLNERKALRKKARGQGGHTRDRRRAQARGQRAQNAAAKSAEHQKATP
jgi:hypothetical protein